MNSPIPGMDFSAGVYIDDPLLRRESPTTQYLPDRSPILVTEDSCAELGTRYSANPYRGCSHGCKYCYARPTHEALGLNAGLDFETKIFIKEDAPELLREFLSRKGWVPQPIAMSVFTDCYQPAERDYRLARDLLEVALEFRQPMSVMTKNALILRDRDVLRALAASNLVHVTFSMATLDPELTRSMEPHTSAPAERLQAIRSLTDAGVPVRVVVAPIISGLNDSEIPALLAAIKVAGAQGAASTMLRLPPVVEPLFLGWLEQAQPGRMRRIEGRLRASSPSTSPSAEPDDREAGPATGSAADSAKPIADLFRVFASRYRLDGELTALDCTAFRRPRAKSGQLLLF
jgi:DNA repair photolyase